MTCWKNNQPDQLWSSAGFGVFIEASSGTTGCSDVKRLTGQITVNALPVVTVSAADKSVCANGNVEIDFSVSATAAGSAVAWALSGAPTVSVEGVVCTAGTPTGECST
jgi:hypothetical protein